jgi:hypothetical protein
MATWGRKDYYQVEEEDNEEEEAMEMLKERAKRMQESDFFPEFEGEELNYGQLTEDELMEVIQKDSPELMDVLESVQSVMAAAKRAKKGEDRIGMQYCRLLALNISFYILLKAKGKVASSHPVVENIQKIEKLLENRHKTETKALSPEIIEEKNIDIAQDVGAAAENSQRKVDEKIKKNKGIVKKRKKIERNVRVKNKMKYQKKLKIRRATLGYKEPDYQGKYSGEATGIRKNLIKSVKLT